MAAAPLPGSADPTALPRPVLVIEDDDAIRKLLIQTLQDDGYPVASAPDGETALEMLDAVRPCLLLLDLRLPGIDGFEFIRRYHRTSPDPATILLLSAAPPPEELPAGTVEFLRKPFDLDVLTDTVRGIIEQMREPTP